jgi:intracellular multiplication protein IcmK
MSSDQIKKIRQLWNESQRAKTFTGSTPPRPANLTRSVNLEVGGLPTVVRLGAGYVSVVSFFDANGKPWPIRGYDIGNPSMVNIVWNQSSPEEDASGAGLSNTLMMQAQTLYRSTNMVVLLRGMNTPILIEIIPGQQVVDYRLDLQVPRKGPMSDDGDGLPGPVEPVMMDLVNNVPPSGSTQLTVTGGEAQAWVHQNRMYLRTPYTILSPAWISKTSGPNGDVNVYEMAQDRVVLALKNGETIQLIIE